MTYMEACEFLGVQIDTSLAECKVIYRRLAQRHHPDRGGDAEMFKTLTEAYRIFERYRPQMDDARLRQQRQSSASPDFRANGANGRGKPAYQASCEESKEEKAEHKTRDYVHNRRAAAVFVVLVGLGYLCWGNELLTLLYILGVGGCLLAALVNERMRYVVGIVVNLLQMPESMGIVVVWLLLELFFRNFY